MVSEERKEKRRAGVRQEVLKAAKQLLQGAGAEALTIRGLADILGYSPAALYEYFSSKDQIILLLKQQVRREWLGTLRQIDPDSLTPQNYIRRVFQEMLALRVLPEIDRILSLPLSETTVEGIPEEVIEFRRFLDNGLQRLNLPGLAEEGQRLNAIFMLRAFMEGVATIHKVKQMPTTVGNLEEIAGNYISLLLKGWR